MADLPEPTGKRLGRPLALSLLGAVLVAPVPIFAALPQLSPAWFALRIGGVPLVSWLLVGLMAALVGVAVLSASNLDPADK